MGDTMFKVTAAAASELLAAAVRSDAAGQALRVAARQTADGSIEYAMGFDEEREGDEPAAFDGLTVLVGSPSQPLLAGTLLDYVEIEPGRCDFVFIPSAGQAGADLASSAPTARGACGSGGCAGCGA